MKKLLAIVVFAAIAAALAYASYSTTRWGGSCGFMQLEYELSFKDSSGSGNPLEGIELKVEDQEGKEVFCFPVTDYLPNHVPKSDKQGVMRFHHVSTMVEWDDYGWSLFWTFPIQTYKSPVYICRFLFDGKEVHRIPYRDLPDWDWPGQGWEDVPKVKRQWDWTAMIPNEIKWREDDTEENHNSRLAEFFHFGNNDKPSRESRIACRNANRLLFHLEGSRSLRAKQEPVEEVEFPVIRRTIVIERPGNGR